MKQVDIDKDKKESLKHGIDRTLFYKKLNLFLIERLIYDFYGVMFINETEIQSLCQR